MKSEALIQSEIMIALSNGGCKVFRANAGRAYSKTGNPIKLFPPGFPDLCGWRVSDGRFFAIEVKNVKGTLSDDQKKFRAMAKKQKILYGVARSVEDALGIVGRE